MTHTSYPNDPARERASDAVLAAEALLAHLSAAERLLDRAAESDGLSDRRARTAYRNVLDAIDRHEALRPGLLRASSLLERKIGFLPADRPEA